MTTYTIEKTDIHASRPWQVLAHCDGRNPIPCGSFKTKRAAQAEVAGRNA
tara:strand:- start:140 stop:289 length:150 start_codon:yes stop_codon:yes gene_type:complete